MNNSVKKVNIKGLITCSLFYSISTFTAYSLYVNARRIEAHTVCLWVGSVLYVYFSVYFTGLFPLYNFELLMEIHTFTIGINYRCESILSLPGYLMSSKADAGEACLRSISDLWRHGCHGSQRRLLCMRKQWKHIAERTK